MRLSFATAVATIGVAAVLSEVDWLAVASASILAGILSLLTSLAGIPEETQAPAAALEAWREDLNDPEG